MNEKNYYGKTITLESINRGEPTSVVKENFKFEKFLLSSEDEVKIKINGNVIKNPIIKSSNSNFLLEPNLNKCACIEILLDDIKFDVVVNCAGDKAYFYIDNDKYKDIDIEVFIFVLWTQNNPLTATIINNPVRWSGMFNNNNTSFRFKLSVNPFTSKNEAEYTLIYSEKDLINDLIKTFDSAIKNDVKNVFKDVNKIIPTQILYISYTNIFGNTNDNRTFQWFHRNLNHFSLENFVNSSHANRTINHNVRLDLLYIEKEGLYGRIIRDKNDILMTPTNIYVDIFITPINEEEHL